MAITERWRVLKGMAGMGLMTTTGMMVSSFGRVRFMKLGGSQKGGWFYLNPFKRMGELYIGTWNKNIKYSEFLKNNHVDPIKGIFTDEQ